MGLSLTNINRRFGAVPAVVDASIDVADGEILCLFGPSGCGKTTLLRVAAGLEPMETGSVSVDGIVLAGNGASLPPERRPIGFVFQDYVLFPHLTAGENVAFGLRGTPRRQRNEAAEGELARVGLEGFARRYPHQLSGGQQQRVALARAFVRRPRAMLLDEPFASIDTVLRRKLRADLRAILKDHGAATILVTHDPEEALALGDRIAVMDRGRIIEAATPGELFEAPKTAAGASLFAGAQTLPGVAVGGRVETPFGVIETTPPAGAGKLEVIVQPGGVAIEADSEGSAVVRECRFRGPDWVTTLAPFDPSAGDETIDVSSPSSARLGERFSLRFFPARVRVFADRRTR